MFSGPRLGPLVIAAVVAGAVLAQTASTTPPTAEPRNAARPTAHPTALVTEHHPLPVPSSTASRRVPPRTKPGTTPAPSGTTPVPLRTRSGAKVVYLTFDDGPQRIWTRKILGVLAKHRAKATFFQLGIQTAEYPDLVTAVRKAGHTVGNHTYDHAHLTRLPANRIRTELRSGPSSRCFRPPFRETDARVVSVAAGMGMRQILWDVDTLDWEKPGAAAIERAVVGGARPGAIVLMHDGGGDRSQTLMALDRALTRLRAKGYTFRSLSC